MTAPPAGAATTRARIAATTSRYSLRLRVFFAVTAAALAPQVLVFAWSQVERVVPGRMWRATRDALEAANERVTVALDAGSPGPDREALIALAHARHVRLRLLCPNGDVCLDENADDPSDPLHPIEAFFFETASEDDIRKIDDAMGPLATRAEVDFARQGGLYVDCQWERGLVCTGTRRAEDRGKRAYIVDVQKSSVRAIQAVYEFRHYLTRLAFLTVPLALALALYAASRVMRPIEELRRQALDRAKGASRGVSLPEHEDEVGDLAAAFNTMLAALDSKRAENEAFVADLVHELKSPVAAVRATAESLAEATPDADRAARFARILADSAGKLDHLVTHFLELARAEAGMPNEERSRVDLGALARGIATRLADDERHAGVTFSFASATSPAPATQPELRDGATESPELAVFGVAHRLDALVRELLENAASFAGKDGHVDVRVFARGREVVLEVTDDGAGISADDLPRVFTRFFTTRGSPRVAGSGPRGTGLGLALVRAVSEAHGGQVSVRSALGQGATFTLVLPRIS